MHDDFIESVNDIRCCDVVVIVYRAGERSGLSHSLSTGVAVMLDKPIICMINSGAPVPDKLARVVDRFVEMRSTRDECLAAVTEAIKELLPERFEDC